nr:RNA-directed DNA polymerase, eukaryota, nucleotide-binding alpha-beta plait domain protein [Tanacetum cinerariifolium]
MSARELWKTCSVYGTVVNVFIPSKKSKAGKRFAFVRFIKVFNLDRLVANLSTIWIGKLHIIANHVRYERHQKPYVNPTSNSGSAKSTPKHNVSQQTNSRVDSYAKAVNSGYSGLQGAAISPSPAMGVTLDLEENANNSFGRKRLCVQTKHATSILETFKVIVKGRMYMVHAKELFTWNPTFLVHEEKEYSVSSLARDIGGKGASHLEDPFGLYKILKKNIGGGNQEPSPSLSHPPGFTPENLENRVEHVTDFGATSGLNAK